MGSIMKILVTGFEPFGGESVNPAQQILEALPQQIGGAEIIKQVVPCVFDESIKVIHQAMQKHHPDAVVCLGQAGGRKSITPERVAINLSDARIPDNAGQQPIDLPIMPDGENAYFSTLPIKAIADALRRENIPCEVSNTAGTYVCNHVMYGVLYWISKEFPQMRGGFIHVPFTEEQVKNKPDVASLPLSEMIRGIQKAVETVACVKQDLHTAEGREH